MSGRLLGDRTAARPLPSTDLYFLSACGHRVDRGSLVRWRRRQPIERRGANCFVHGDAMLLIRRDRPAVMREALAWPGRLAYLVDDDIAGAADSPELPEDYRHRLAAFDRDYHQLLLARADLLVVPADPLAHLFAAEPEISARIRRIDPYWPEPLADQHHFTALEGGAPLRIAHLGSASHGGALGTIAPLVSDLLAAREDIDFTYVAPGPVHPALDHHARAHRVRPMVWPAWRRWLARRRFHLALYPLAASRFDAARSSNKLYEHAIAGAVGVYPQRWPPAQALGDDGALFAPADPAEWGLALAEAIGRRDELKRLAAGAADALARQAPQLMQQNVWRAFFGIEF